MFEPPFRWNLTHHVLGSLLEGAVAGTYEGFHNDLLACCSRVLAFAGDCDLVFVGRSPESLFDHLSGLLFDTKWKDRLWLLQYSMRLDSFSEVRRGHPEEFWALRSYFESLNLSPKQLELRPRPVCFVDLIYSGGTLGTLVEFLHAWTLESGADWNAVRRRIRIVGVTGRTKNSPNTWRWQQHANWVELLPTGALKNVSVPWNLWCYLGNEQLKVTRSFFTKHWANPDYSTPYYGEAHLMALRLAVSLFNLGRTAENREEFIVCLTNEVEMKEPWLRSLVIELRGNLRSSSKK